VLEESLLEFPGALVLVTHDRYLMDRVATERLELWSAAAVPPLSERRHGRRTPHYIIRSPPLMSKLAPVMYPAASDAAKQIRSATSRAVPRRGTG